MLKAIKILVVIHRVLNLSKFKLPPWWQLQITFVSINTEQPDYHKQYVQQYQQHAKGFSPLSQILQTNTTFWKNQLPCLGRTTNLKKQLTKI